MIWKTTLSVTTLRSHVLPRSFTICRVLPSSPVAVIDNDCDIFDRTCVKDNCWAVFDEGRRVGDASQSQCVRPTGSHDNRVSTRGRASGEESFAQ